MVLFTEIRYLERKREGSKLAGFIVLNILVVINHQIPSYIMPSCLLTYKSINLVKIHQRGQACNLSTGTTNIQITPNLVRGTGKFLFGNLGNYPFQWSNCTLYLHGPSIHNAKTKAIDPLCNRFVTTCTTWHCFSSHFRKKRRSESENRSLLNRQQLLLVTDKQVFQVGLIETGFFPLPLLCVVRR